MVEQLYRGFLPVDVNIGRSCRVRPVEYSKDSVIPDRSFKKEDLPLIFGQDIESLVENKLSELGFIPQNEEEKKLLRLLDNPLIHKYPTGDSPARYFLEVVMGKDAILASYLPPKLITHPHPHSKKYGILEGYHPIGGGEAILHLGKEPFALITSKEVPLDVFHQLEAGKKPAFTLIIMKNAGLVDRKNWHK